VTLTWKAYPLTARYRIRVGTAPDWANCGQNNDVMTRSTQVTVTGISAGTKCYWSVQALGTEGHTLSVSSYYWFAVEP
jgi:hypothetical protein